ncbi:MAG: hypothetical protein Q4D76_00605 [Oscillospiraceae bacterium]|nr:hypothetical protein [Oscillospiraceae bacterium]
MKSYINKDESKVLKGVAVILMIMVHTFKVKWIDESVCIYDLKVNNQLFSHIIAEVLHDSSAIFAFVTGYACALKRINFKDKIKKIQSLYISYWVVLFTVNFPFHVINDLIINDTVSSISTGEIVKTVFGISSNISKFNWYIIFYVFAILSFDFVGRQFLLIKNWKIRYASVILFFFCLRILARKLMFFNLVNESLLSIIQSYNTMMPCWMIGYFSLVDSIYIKFDSFLENKKIKSVIPILMLGIIYIGKYCLKFIFMIDSGLSSFWILFEIYSILYILRYINNFSKIRKILISIGENSLYIWLSSSVFILESIQPFTYVLKFPFLIVFMEVIIMIVLAKMLKLIDIGLRTCLQK